VKLLRFGIALLVLPLLVPAWSVSGQMSPAAAVLGAALPLGSFVVTSSTSTSETFNVSCPEVSASLSGTLLIQPASGSPRGLVMFFSGSYGTTAWSTSSISNAWLASVASAGYEVVQLEWSQPGWEAAPSGQDAGQAHVACRPATAIRWVHDNLYAALHVPSPGTGVCGFCITGNSGGASQVAYALAYYGLGSILNGVFPTSGPPHAALAKGCLNQSGYVYGPLALQIIDSSNGFYGSTGPCDRHDPSFTARWNQESVDTNGSYYYYSTTRLHFIFGAQDTQSAKQHAEDYISRLTAAGSPMVTQETVGSMAHEVATSTTGMAALLAAIEAGAPSSGPPPSPTPGQSPGASPTPGTSPSPGVLASPHVTPGGSRSSPRPVAFAGQSPGPGGPGSSPLAGVSRISAAVFGANTSRLWLWVIVVGIALAAAAMLLLPRVGLLQRVVRTVRRSNNQGPPPS